MFSVAAFLLGSLGLVGVIDSVPIAPSVSIAPIAGIGSARALAVQVNRRALRSSPVTLLQATDYGVIANDGRDDTQALQQLLDWLRQAPKDRLTAPAQFAPVCIRLPAGEITLSQPLTISRSHLTLQGAGMAQTVLNLQSLPIAAPAALHIAPPTHTPLQAVLLEGFTLRLPKTSPVALSPTGQPHPNYQGPGIQFEQTIASKIRRVKIEGPEGSSSIRLSNSEVEVEYTTPQLLSSVLQKSW